MTSNSKNPFRLPSELSPGDIYESANGNRYLILDATREVYIGNRDASRSEALMPRRLSSQIQVKKIGFATGL